MKMAIVVSIAFFGLLWASPASAQGDLTAPVLVDMQIEPQVVDTAESAQTITFTARITDDLSGFRSASLGYKTVVPTTQSLWIPFSEQDRVTGDARDGVYVNIGRLPQYAAEGRWVLDYVFLEDMVGNRLDIWSSYEEWPAQYDTYYIVNGEDNVPIEPEPGEDGRLFMPVVVR